jgi:hypothetical protein
MLRSRLKLTGAMLQKRSSSKAQSAFSNRRYLRGAVSEAMEGQGCPPLGDTTDARFTPDIQPSVPARSNSGKEAGASGGLMALFNRPKVKAPAVSLDNEVHDDLPGAPLFCGLLRTGVPYHGE